MQFEHFALNVPDAVKMAEWFVAHLAMRIVVSTDTEPYTRFLADQTGRVVMEIYTNNAASVPDYRSLHPLSFHRAFSVTDAGAARARLVEAGAEFVDEVRTANGSVLCMLRDPWGVPLQLCQRSVPFGRNSD